TLATHADEAGIRTCVVSTDRDAFQLVTDNVVLMMTPRGVADVNVYTPDRVEARYGIRPDQVPDFIGLKGDTSDNIPGVPGRGDILDEAVPAQAMRMPGTEVVWREGEFPEVQGRAAIAIRDGRFALAREDDGVIVGSWDAALERRLDRADVVAHDFKALPRL